METAQKLRLTVNDVDNNTGESRETGNLLHLGLRYARKDGKVANRPGLRRLSIN